MHGFVSCQEADTVPPSVHPVVSSVVMLRVGASGASTILYR